MTLDKHNISFFIIAEEWWTVFSYVLFFMQSRAAAQLKGFLHKK